MRKTILLAIGGMSLWALLLVPPKPHAAASPQTERIVLTVQSAPEASFRSELEIRSDSLSRALRKEGRRMRVPGIPFTDATLTIEGKTVARYWVDGRGRLYDGSRGEMQVLPSSARDELSRLVGALRQVHYGRIVPWSEAEKLIPRKSVLTIVDPVTGLKFRAQRRAGSSHADAQPLTKEDTAVMKRIYGGDWSWKRKAILVRTESQVLAASMHGMPHGGDGIPNNNFSGHFCIHFLGSTTHGSGHIDPEHQTMIRKAGGQLEEYIRQASPTQIAELFVMALNLQDAELLRMLFPHDAHPQFAAYLAELPKIGGMRQTKESTAADFADSLAAEIPVHVSMLRAGEKEQRLTLTFTLTRNSLAEPWKIDHIAQVSARSGHTTSKSEKGGRMR